MKALHAGAALAALALAAPMAAQDPGTLRDRYRLPAPPTMEVAARGAWAAPGIALGIPSGFGADQGDGFAGIGFQHRTRLEDRPDGGVVAGVGIGDARRALALEAAVSQFGTLRSCCRGGVSFKLHKLLPAAGASVALGWENAATWGRMAGADEATDAGTSVYLVGSKLFRLRDNPAQPLGSMSLTAGVGTGRFRTEEDILDGQETVGVFGGGSVRLAAPASLIVDWTGQDLVAGLSLVPFRRIPLALTPGVADLTTEPRFILGVGYGFNFHVF
jgi:hypothetical protein